MANISVEQKLTMLSQLRSRYDNNQADLMRREQILYATDTAPARGTFRLRLLIAAILAVMLILSDRGEKDFLGVSTSQIYTMIEKDYMTQMEEFINQSQQAVVSQK